MQTLRREGCEIPSQTDVLIVGAGPTGLALAIGLRQAGVDYVLIDKLAEGLNTSRAGVIHAHTLEMLENLGVAGKLTQQGLRVTRFCIRDRDRALLRLDFKQLPSEHRYLLMLPQDQTERILRERLEALGGRIFRGVTATGLEQDGTGVQIRLSAGSGEGTVRARYVVGADGVHSVVRAAAGTEFEGGTYADSFVLADVVMDWPFGITEVSMYFSPAGFVVVAPLPDGSFRIVATMEDPPEEPSIADIQALMEARGPASGNARVRKVLWSSRFRIHHRVAKAYRNGRLLLMGDAAHVHSPAGGQGMNTGLVDAVVLGRLLPTALAGGGDDVLAEYHRLRRPAAAEVLSLAGRLTAMATVRSRVGRLVRNLAVSLVDMLGPAKRRILMNFSGLSRKRFAEVPQGDGGFAAAERSERPTGHCARKGTV